MKLAQITDVNPPGPLSGLKFPDYKTLPNDIVSRFLLFAIVASGLFFFVRLLSAGYQLLTSLGDSGKVQNATKELTNAVVGLLVVISSFFLAQILQTILGVNLIS